MTGATSPRRVPLVITRSRAEDPAAVPVYGPPPAGTAFEMGGHARSGRPLHIELPTDESVARAARQFVTDAVGQLGRPDLAEVGALLVSELVSNVVRHTDAGSCRVCLGGCGGAEGETGGRASAIVVEVADCEHGDVAPGPAPGERDEHGRGLHIVAALADAWGVRQTATEKSVWFRLGS